MSAIIDRVFKGRIQKYVDGLSREELATMTEKFDTDTVYAGSNNHIHDGDDEDYKTTKGKYVHRHIIIRKGAVHVNNRKHRNIVAYFHPWMKGYLEKVGKSLWAYPPTFCKPKAESSNEDEDSEEPEEDERIKLFWEENRLQEMMRKAWWKAQVHGILFYYPMESAGFIQGYSGPPWYVYAPDEMGIPSLYSQGHPVKWTITHSNPEKSEPHEIAINQGVFYDYKNTDDFTGEPFGLGIWDILIDWIYIQDSINAFDQRMGNGFFTMVVPQNTSPTEMKRYENAVRNTRTEKGLVVRGNVDEPVTFNWVGMAGVQVDFIAHMEKLEDLITFNMGFPKRWIMGDEEGAMESSGKDALKVNIQLKILYMEWTLLMKRVLLYHGIIQSYKDVVIKPPFELELSEQERLELDALKTETIAAKTWASINEQRKMDGLLPTEEEGADKVLMQQPKQDPTIGQDQKPEAEGKKPTKPKSDSDIAATFEVLADVLTEGSIGVNELARISGVSPATISKMRDKFDALKKPIYKCDDLVFKTDSAVEIAPDIWEVQDVPLVLPQTKEYKHLGYNAIRPREEIERIFKDPAYPKQFRIGVTASNDHSSRVPLEVLKDASLGMVDFKRLDEEGNIRGNIRYNLQDADRILGTDNYVRERTQKGEDIPTSIALWSKDIPVKNGMLESDLDIRSFMFTTNPRNNKAGRSTAN